MSGWTLARLTADLTADGDWRGLERSSASAPASTGASSIFFPCGAGAGSALVVDGQVLIRVLWCSSAGIPVAGAGTSITVEPVTIDALAMPTNAAQRIEVLSVGVPREHAAATPVPYTPLFLYVGHAALATVRLTNMVNAGAARVAVEYWAR